MNRWQSVISLQVVPAVAACAGGGRASRPRSVIPVASMSLAGSGDPGKLGRNEDLASGLAKVLLMRKQPAPH
jgi:hypothetical protein